MNVAVVDFSLENEDGPIFPQLRQVCESCKGAAENQFDFTELHEKIMQLEGFIFSLEQDEAGATALWQGLSPELIAGLNDAYCLWQTELEYQFAQGLVRGEVNLSEYPLFERFGELVKAEVALTAGARPQRILFIASGPLPISAIHFHLQTGAPVDCVAREADAADITRRTLEKCGLGSTVRLIEEGAGYDVSAYDVIVVGALAKPKKNILTALRKQSRAGCQILCRTSRGLKRLAFAQTVEQDRRGFHLKQEQVAGEGQLISTYLLEPAASAASDVRLEWLKGIDSNTAGQLLRLVNRTLEEETTIGYAGPIDEQTGLSIMRQLNEDVESGHRHVLVAYKDGVIVGQMILTPNLSPNHRHIVELTRGTIHPNFRGGGLPLQAFHEVLKKCRELGREVICLDVRAGTRAAVLWRYFGFKQYGALADYARVGGNTYEGLYMSQTTEELKFRLSEIARTVTAGAQNGQVAEVA
jgi:GNAT superfamily N-acetyltransferase